MVEVAMKTSIPSKRSLPSPTTDGYLNGCSGADFCRSVVVSPNDPHHRHRDRHEPPYVLQKACLEVLAASLNPPRCTLTELSELFRLELGVTAAIASGEVRLERGDQRVDLLCRRVGRFRGELFLTAEGVAWERVASGPNTSLGRSTART